MVAIAIAIANAAIEGTERRAPPAQHTLTAAISRGLEQTRAFYCCRWRRLATGASHSIVALELIARDDGTRQRSSDARRATNTMAIEAMSLALLFLRAHAGADIDVPCR